MKKLYKVRCLVTHERYSFKVEQIEYRESPTMFHVGIGSRSRIHKRKMMVISSFTKNGANVNAAVCTYDLYCLEDTLKEGVNKVIKAARDAVHDICDKAIKMNDNMGKLISEQNGKSWGQ